MRFTAKHPAFTLLLLACAMPGRADIYQWQDENGKRHFGDQKPADRPVESFQGSAAVSFMGGGEGGAIRLGKVRIFVTQSCPYCKKAKAFLRRRGTPFEELDVEKSTSANAEYKRLGGQGVPVILVGQQRMDGFNEGDLTSLLKSAGL